MKSIIVSLSGKSPTLSTNLHPEIELDERFEYSCCLLDFSIHNISLKHNFKQKIGIEYLIENEEGSRWVTINPGERDLVDIMNQVAININLYGSKTKFDFDKDTMKFRISASNAKLYLPPTSFGALIGYDSQTLERNTITEANNRIGQIDARRVRINCNLISGSFDNGIDTHTVHEFHPKPVSNYKMLEQPQHLIYLPITRQRINSVNITVTDQDGKLIDLQGGEIHCRLNIKRGLY